METIATVGIPDAEIEFAKKVAEAAEEHGIKEFKMGYQGRTFSHTGQETKDRSITSDITISYSGRDGRGRPRTKLSVSCEARIQHDIVNEPDSSN